MGSGALCRGVADKANVSMPGTNWTAFETEPGHRPARDPRPRGPAPSSKGGWEGAQGTPLHGPALLSGLQPCPPSEPALGLPGCDRKAVEATGTQQHQFHSSVRRRLTAPPKLNQSRLVSKASTGQTGHLPGQGSGPRATQASVSRRPFLPPRFILRLSLLSMFPMCHQSVSTALFCLTKCFTISSGGETPPAAL